MQGGGRGFLEAGAPRRCRHLFLALCPSFQGLSPRKPRNSPRLPINCLCPHLLGDASGRLGRWENLFPDPIQRRGLLVRDLHSHRRHRLQGEVAAGSASSEPGAAAQAQGALPSPRLPRSSGRLWLGAWGAPGVLPGDHRGGQLEESRLGGLPATLQDMRNERWVSRASRPSVPLPMALPPGRLGQGLRGPPVFREFPGSTGLH